MTEVRHAMAGVSSRVRKSDKAHGDDTTLSRWVKIKGEPMAPPRRSKQMWLPDLQHKALENGTSIFTKNGVKSLDQVSNVLVSGHNNVKIGRDVRKGRLFRGYWIYTLTLEERATCPRSCQHWQTCYGNNMPYAKRIRVEPGLHRAIEHNIIDLLDNPRRVGILIRLHALGDFFSPEYVAFWATMLRKYPKLAVYGYTARTPNNPDPETARIGEAIRGVKKRFGRRFAIRWSDGGGAEDCTISVRTAADTPKGAFHCPEQSGKTAACATCALCWETTKNVAFAEH